MAEKAGMDHLVATLPDFRNRLDRIKKENSPADFTWYGYDILNNIHLIDQLLTGANRRLFDGMIGHKVADVGAADGDLSFFLEEHGLMPHIIDWAPTNWNGLKGANRLRELLGSRAEIHEIDLDSQFSLPPERYELVLLLGTLYHLKNPFFVLERLREAARYLILSTRIASLTRRKGGLGIAKEPLAYLLGPDELNNDRTNYWIFSEAGLKQLVQRSGWQLRDFRTFGATGRSTPQDMDLDERAFMLVESRNSP